MTITIATGAWLLPAAVTISTLLLAAYVDRDHAYGGAVSISVIAWLAWAVFA